MKLWITVLLFFSFSTTKAQTEIKLENVANHVGDSVKMKGRIFGVKYLDAAKNTPTFINVGAAYPNQLLTVVIWGDVRKQLDYTPEDKKYAGGMAVVTGRVELFNGKPQIVIHTPEQLTILYDEEVPTSQLPPIKQN